MMTGQPITRRILVGYDGSEESDRALCWAEREAELREIGITVCTVWRPIAPALGDGDPAVVLGHRAARRTLAAGGAHARRVLAADSVRTVLARGSAGKVLCWYAQGAEMAVVGSRGIGGFTGLLAGSVSAWVAAHACGRVVVVRDMALPVAARPSGEIVVGFDGSPAARAALAWGFEEAGLRQVALVVVRAWDHGDPARPGHVERTPMERQAAAQGLADAVRPLRQRYPDVPARTAFVDRPPQAVLLDAARGAGLLIIGSRGLGMVRAVLLGSVGRAMIQRAPCPVAVAHAR